MKIKEIKITNFLSISDLTIDINNLLIMIGKNNVGKSNFLMLLMYSLILEQELIQLLFL